MRPTAPSSNTLLERPAAAALGHARHPYALVPDGCPLAPALADFRAQLREHSRYAELLAAMERGAPIELRSLIKETGGGDRGPTLKRLYLSFQVRAEGEPLAFGADTFLYRFESGKLEFHRFPNDPRLPGIAPLAMELARRGENAGEPAAVLRYVPLKRFTFRARWHGRDAPPAVGKLVSPARLSALHGKLEGLYREVSGGDVSFAVARPIALDEAHGVVLQEVRPGQDLATLLARDNFRALLHAAGRIHAEIHRLKVPGMPRLERSDQLAATKQRIAWICYLFPQHARYFDRIAALLESRMPEPIRYALCQGDFRCTHLLLDDARWSVIDLDESVCADPHWEIGMFLALLKSVPLFDAPDSSAGRALAEARRAYLQGYEEGARVPVDAVALRWYRVAGEIFYLARLLKRDLCRSGDLARSAAMIGAAARELDRRGELDGWCEAAA